MTDRWQDSLENEELKASPVLDRYKTPEDAYQGLINKEAKLGNSFTLLGKDATDEERSTYVTESLSKHFPELMMKPDFDSDDGANDTWKMLGRPDAEDGYTLPEDFSGLDDDMITQLQGIAASAGMTVNQYHSMLKHYATATEELNNTNTLAKDTHDDELKTKWGAAHEQNMSITDTLVEKFQDPNEKLGDLNNAARLFIMNIAKSLSSDPQIFDQINNPEPTPSPSEAREQLAQMRNSPVYHNVGGKYGKDERKAFLKKYNGLIALAGA